MTELPTEFFGRWDAHVKSIQPKSRKPLAPNVRTITDLLRSEESAKIDPLTKLGSRRAYEDDKKQIEQLLGKKGGVIFLADLDGLKKVNDTLGHQAGDEIIQKAGSFFIAHTLVKDPKYRYGGDEIVGFLFGIPEKKVKKRMTKLIGLANARVKEDPLAPRFSIGYDYVPAGSRVSCDELVNHADRALYLAKDIEKEKKDWKSHAVRWSENIPT
jgi:diguanylate cyclase (GGDEF)-like protein